ncbi:MAG TPA: hypothetical protein VH000_07245 [Rhizomicrobium sp.]|jgi:hypothetical protein|nr:hypothetical protein [Rhizomicrobium sp.]
MSAKGARYPGDSATVEQVLRLAEAYRAATAMLLLQEPSGDGPTRAPCRLSAIHAIELYLDALLLRSGHTASSIREMGHDLAARTELAVADGLCLRDRTAKHLAAMSSNKEYVTTRYDVEMSATLSQLNRLTATLEEVASKVTARCAAKAPAKIKAA